MFRIKNSTSTFSQTINNSYVPKKIHEVFEFNWATAKITTKTWLAKVAAIFTYRTSLHHRIRILGFFLIQKEIYLVFILRLVFWFLLLICMFEWLTFSCYKEQQEQCKRYCWRRKIKQMLNKELYHIICLFKRNSSRISLSQLSVSYILRENSLGEGKLLDNKNFMKLLTNQKFCL